MTSSSCQGTTRYWNPNGSPFSGNFAFSCASPSFCPYLVWQGGTGKCCPYANQLVCLDGSCRSDTNCPTVVSSKAPVVAPTSIIVTPTPTPTPTPARVSSAANTPIVIVASSPAASSVSGTTTCSGGLVCGNNWFCSTDNPPQCCPKQGQSLCSGASTCFSPSNGEQCCGNTICYAGQSCAPGGNACIGPSSSQASSTTLTFSTLTSARSFSDIVPSPTATNGSDSDPLNILQTAVPKTAQDDPAGACFLNTKYHTYTTPAWYTAMPTPAQSYFASVNAQNTGACTGASSSSSSGLSDGAKAGIGLGVLAGVAAFGALAFAFLKLGIIGSGATGAGSGAAGGGAAASQPPPVWSGQTGGENAWNGMTGTDPLSQHPPMGYMPPVIVAGAAKRSSSSDQNRSSYIPYRPPVGHPAHSHYSNTSAYSNYQPQVPPPRSVSPLESSPTELYSNGANRLSEVSGHGNTSPVQELSTSGAYPGHEIYSNERYEAPSGPDIDYPHSPHQGPEVQGYGTQGYHQGYGQGY